MDEGIDIEAKVGEIRAREQVLAGPTDWRKERKKLQGLRERYLLPDCFVEVGNSALVSDK